MQVLIKGANCMEIAKIKPKYQDKRFFSTKRQLYPLPPEGFIRMRYIAYGEEQPSDEVLLFPENDPVPYDVVGGADYSVDGILSLIDAERTQTLRGSRLIPATAARTVSLAMEIAPLAIVAAVVAYALISNGGLRMVSLREVRALHDKRLSARMAVGHVMFISSLAVLGVGAFFVSGLPSDIELAELFDPAYAEYLSAKRAQTNLIVAFYASALVALFGSMILFVSADHYYKKATGWVPPARRIEALEARVDALEGGRRQDLRDLDDGSVTARGGRP